MKNPLPPFLAVLFLAASALSLSAETNWTGNTNANLTNAGNWDNGLPDSDANPGTIPDSAGVITHSFNLNGYYITQNGGTLTSSVAFSPSNGSWTLNSGGTLSPGVNTTFQNQDNGSQSFTMNGGSFSATQMNVSSSGTNRSATFLMSDGTATMSGRFDINVGGSVTLDGGSLTASASRMASGTTLTINGGNHDFGTEMGRSGSIFMNGGTTTVDQLATYAGFAMTLGGTTAGSFVVDALGGSFMPPNRSFDWLTGSLMTFTVVNDDDWAETEWNANRLTYNGDSKSDLADLSWADAQTDLGDGSYFVYDHSTYELSLVSGGGDDTPYETWATGGELFGDDKNGDGVSNGLAFLLGAADPDADATDLLPTVSEAAGGLVMIFQILDSTSRGTAALSVEHSSDLGDTDPWIVVAVPDSDAGPTSGVSFEVSAASGSPSVHSVTATIGSGEAVGGKLFGRLSATE